MVSMATGKELLAAGNVQRQSRRGAGAGGAGGVSEGGVPPSVGRWSGGPPPGKKLVFMCVLVLFQSIWM